MILKKQAGFFFSFFVTSLNPIILLIFKLCFNKLFQLPQIVLLEHCASSDGPFNSQGKSATLIKKTQRKTQLTTFKPSSNCPFGQNRERLDDSIYYYNVPPKIVGQRKSYLATEFLQLKKGQKYSLPQMICIFCQFYGDLT